MARIRTIKPTHVNDKQLVNISLPAHLFWILSWCFSDDEGVMENDPLLLKSHIFPRRTDIRTEQIQQWIDQLSKARFIIPFTHEGEGYLLHRTFRAHQRIDKPQSSKIPKDVITRIIQEHSKNDIGTLLPVKEGNGEEEESNGRPNGLVAAGNEKGRQDKLKKVYKSLSEELKGKDKKTIWNSLKDFMQEKPNFLEPVVDVWNLFSDSYKLPAVKGLSDSRKKKYETRAREPDFDFIKILEKIKGSAHLKGDNQQGWKITFDWVLENDKNYLKILEGNYD